MKKKILMTIIISFITIIFTIIEINIIKDSTGDIYKPCLSSSIIENCSYKRSTEKNVYNEPVVICIGNNRFGTIANEDEAKSILERVGRFYIDKSEIDKSTILAVDIKTNIEYEECKDYMFSLDSVDEIAEKIVEENKNNELVDVNIQCKEIRNEEIEPGLKVINTEDMYIGESKEEKGVVGCKQVTAKVRYTNGIKTEEEILGEKVLIQSTDNIVYKGCKNPINDGIAFLCHPTNGGSITSKFGVRWGKKHNGIDIAHNTGDPVYSAFDGLVKECKYENGYGNKITIEHEGNIQTVYAHLSAFETQIGAEIKKGDLIGRVGNTGNSTGPHLHFELRINGVPIDPQRYIQC